MILVIPLITSQTLLKSSSEYVLLHQTRRNTLLVAQLDGGALVRYNSRFNSHRSRLRRGGFDVDVEGWSGLGEHGVDQLLLS